MIDEAMVLPIYSFYDAINARRQVRELARCMGFSISEQAAISLAAWTVLDKLGFGGGCPGEITVDTVVEMGRQGLRVKCVCQNGHHAMTLNEFASAHWMVDQLVLNEDDDHHLQVMIIKWVDGA